MDVTVHREGHDKAVIVVRVVANEFEPARGLDVMRWRMAASASARWTRVLMPIVSIKLSCTTAWTGKPSLTASSMVSVR